jgi:hypothetical protein
MFAMVTGCVLFEAWTGVLNVFKTNYGFKGLKTIVFCHIHACSLVDVDQRFRGAFCLHHDGDAPLKCRPTSEREYGAMSVMTVFFMLAAMRT